MRRLLAPAALAVVLILLAAACGSDEGSDTSATATWADEVCSSVTTWTNALTASVDSLKGGNVSREALEGAVDDVKSATDTFVDDLKGLGKPDTEAGQEAKDSVDQLADQLEQEVDEIEGAVDDVSGASGELEDAFRESDSCQGITGASG